MVLKQIEAILSVFYSLDNIINSNINLHIILRNLSVLKMSS